MVKLVIMRLLSSVAFFAAFVALATAMEGLRMNAGSQWTAIIMGCAFIGAGFGVLAGRPLIGVALAVVLQLLPAGVVRFIQGF